MSREKYSHNGIMDLAVAVAKCAADDYRKTLKSKQGLENKKAKLLREHVKLANDTKTENCSRAEFMLKHHELQAARLELEKSRKRNKSDIKSLERWFVSEYGQLLCFGKGKFIMDTIRKEVSE